MIFLFNVLFKLNPDDLKWLPDMALIHTLTLNYFFFSDTGAKPPESCVFGLMTVITAFAGEHRRTLKPWKAFCFCLSWNNLMGFSRSATVPKVLVTLPI